MITYFVIVILPIVLLFTVLFCLKKYHGLKRKRAPFSNNLLRSPGESIRKKLFDIDEEINFCLTVVFLFPSVIGGAFMSHLYFSQKPPGLMEIVIIAIFITGFTGYHFYKLILFFNCRRKLRLAYQGEVVTGQELNMLMRDGYHVYHDFPADNFNIDHIVIGASGIFAVETKTRSKPTSDNRKADATVIYDGEKLKFPRWQEVKPLSQARNQALWLSNWLSSATGERFQVRPVITLPGWFVQRTSSEGFPVINPKSFRLIAKPFNGIKLTENQITKIVHQIDQRCRDVESHAIGGLTGESQSKN